MGTPHPNFYDWSRITICFHGLKGLLDDNDNNEVESPPFMCLGHKWTLGLMVYVEEEDADFGFSVQMISGVLHHQSKYPIPIEAEISINSADKKKLNKHGGMLHHCFKGDEAVILPIGMFRISDLLDSELELEVRMVCCDEKSLPPFLPTNPSACKTIRNLFMDKASSDVVFEIFEHQLGDDGRKKKKTAHVTFYAHRVILKTASPLLAELCKSTDGSPSRIQIFDVSSNTFHHLISYMYGRELSVNAIKVSHMKEIIEAADKYGVTGLKLEAEALYVASTTICFENVLDNLLYAQSKNCALLMESVMDFIVKNKDAIIEKKTLTDAPGGLINDVLAAVLREQNKKTDRDATFNSMRISDLRRRACEEGLEVDGSREMLVSDLKSLE